MLIALYSTACTGHQMFVNYSLKMTVGIIDVKNNMNITIEATQQPGLKISLLLLGQDHQVTRR